MDIMTNLKAKSALEDWADVLNVVPHVTRTNYERQLSRVLDERLQQNARESMHTSDNIRERFTDYVEKFMESDQGAPQKDQWDALSTLGQVNVAGMLTLKDKCFGGTLEIYLNDHDRENGDLTELNTDESVLQTLNGAFKEYDDALVAQQDVQLAHCISTVLQLEKPLKTIGAQADDIAIVNAHVTSALSPLNAEITALTSDNKNGELNVGFSIRVKDPSVELNFAYDGKSLVVNDGIGAVKESPMKSIEGVFNGSPMELSRLIEDVAMMQGVEKEWAPKTNKVADPSVVKRAKPS
jgi:hypothetical protein